METYWSFGCNCGFALGSILGVVLTFVFLAVLASANVDSDDWD